MRLTRIRWLVMMLGLQLIGLSMSGCAPAVAVRAETRVEALPALESLRAGCHRDEQVQDADRWICTTAGIGVAAHALIDCGYDLRDCRASLDSQSQLAGIDRAELRGAVARAEAEMDSARSQRWVWGAIGVAVGAIITGVVVGAAK